MGTMPDGAPSRRNQPSASVLAESSRPTMRTSASGTGSLFTAFWIRPTSVARTNGGLGTCNGACSRKRPRR